MAKRPTIRDQAAVAVCERPSPLVQPMLSDESLVELLADVRRGRAAAARTHINASDMEPGVQEPFDVIAMTHAAESIIDRHPKREVPHPALLRINLAGRL